MEKKFIKPDNMFAPTGYTHALAVDGARRLIFVSGQVARDHTGCFGMAKSKIRDSSPAHFLD